MPVVVTGRHDAEASLPDAQVRQRASGAWRCGATTRPPSGGRESRKLAWQLFHRKLNEVCSFHIHILCEPKVQPCLYPNKTCANSAWHARLPHPLAGHNPTVAGTTKRLKPLNTTHYSSALHPVVISSRALVTTATLGSSLILHNIAHLLGV
eukprot:567484-Prorocentrum_minimum.AAC.3